MYKLIAIDLDGTLLNSFGEVSDDNKQALKYAIEKGSEIVLASGRIVSSIRNYSNETGANRYLISGNGSILYDLQKEEVIYDNYMTKEKVLKIIKICEENSIYYSVYTESAILTNSLNYNVLFYHHENANKPESKQITINVTPNLMKYIQESNVQKYSKVTVCDKDNIVFSSIIKRLKQIKNIDVLDVAHMSRKVIKAGTQEVNIEYYYTEITNENVNKWNTLMVLMNKLSIQACEVMTIGDNRNDKEMLENAGLGVVMGNSAPYIKELGDVVVADNNSNGVAEAIYRYNA